MSETQGWTAIVTAIGYVLIQLYSMYLDYQRNKEAVAARNAVAQKVEVVAAKVDEVNGSHAEKLQEISEKFDSLKSRK